MNITFFAKNMEQGYSGGRYHSWLMAEALAMSGHSVTYITNCVPEFISDCRLNPAFGKVKMIINGDWRQMSPSERQDIVVVVPHLAYLDGFFSLASDFAEEHDAKLVLLNFETPNWFNQNGAKRDPALWENWLNITESDCLVLSISKIGMEFAEKFYTRFPETTCFDFCHPSINDSAADVTAGVQCENRIIVITRFSDMHKGSELIANVLVKEMKGYTLTVTVGSTQLGLQQQTTITRAAEALGIKAEFLFSISDRDKFAEIRKARLMLFPSLFEGFGYPPVEAGYCGTPCVCFDLPVLREVNAEYAAYAPPGDIAAFREIAGGVLDGCIKIKSNPDYYKFATQAAYAKRINSILSRYMARPTGKRKAGELSKISKIALENDLLAKRVANTIKSQQAKSVSIYGAGKNGMLIYCILAGLNVTVSEIYDDAQKGRLGSHKIRTYDDAETKDPVFVAISENNPVTAVITRKIAESGRVALGI